MASPPISRSNSSPMHSASPSTSPNRPLQPALSSGLLVAPGGLQGRGMPGSASEASSPRVRVPPPGPIVPPVAITGPVELRPQAEQLVGSVHEHLQNLESILPNVQAVSNKAATSAQLAITLFESQVSQAPLELGPPARARQAFHALENVDVAVQHLEHRAATRWTGRHRLQQVLTQMRPIAGAINNIRTSPQTTAFIAGLHDQQNRRLAQADSAVREGGDLEPARARLSQSTRVIAQLMVSIANDGRAISATAASNLDTASRELLRTLPGVTASELHEAFNVAEEFVRAALVRLQERRTPVHLVVGSADMLSRMEIANSHLANLRESVEYQQLSHERPPSPPGQDCRVLNAGETVPRLATPAPLPGPMDQPPAA